MQYQGFTYDTEILAGPARLRGRVLVTRVDASPLPWGAANPVGISYASQLDADEACQRAIRFALAYQVLATRRAEQRERTGR